MPTPSLTLFQSTVSYLVRGRKIYADTDLYNVDKNDVVPSGVAEVALLQVLGYAYIKP